jgi:sugar phosphate isomerase/epimerase
VKLSTPAGAHLTYCTNIHPGEVLGDVEELLRTFVPDVKRRVSPDAPFGVGLRLAARAATELEAPGALERVRSLLGESGLYVFTLNGFPYGAFHGTRVKERVYDPDWRTDERVRYTASLAHALAALLPEGMDGSISTVPGCFGPPARTPGAPAEMARKLVSVAATLVTIERTTGKRLVLALEPEPACFLETTADAVAFFENELFGAASLAALAEDTGLDVAGAERALRRHVGVCLDACHASVEFERPRDALAALDAAGIAVPKLQLSAGLRVAPADAAALQALRAFEDDVYLHQTVAKERDGSLVRFLDLDEALATAGDPARAAPFSELRVHFHVPIFEPSLAPFSSTHDDLAELLRGAPALPPHLEVETYTFGVLPERYRTLSVTDAIARELEWALARLAERR